MRSRRAQQPYELRPQRVQRRELRHVLHAIRLEEPALDQRADKREVGHGCRSLAFGPAARYEVRLCDLLLLQDLFLGLGLARGDCARERLEDRVELWGVEFGEGEDGEAAFDHARELLGDARVERLEVAQGDTEERRVHHHERRERRFRRCRDRCLARERGRLDMPQRDVMDGFSELDEARDGEIYVLQEDDGRVEARLEEAGVLSVQVFVPLVICAFALVSRVHDGRLE